MAEPAVERPSWSMAQHEQQDSGEQTTFLRGDPALPGLVASTVGYHSTGRRPSVHRGLPSPYLTFIVSLDEPISTGRSPEHLASSAAHRNDVLLAGLHTAPTFVDQPAHEAGIQVAVHPLAARALLDARARELDLLTIEGADLLGPAITRLRQQLLEEPDWATRFDLLGDYLRRRVEYAGRTAQVRPEVIAAWAWIARHRGTGTMRGLAQHVALSERQLTTLFRRELGVAPKQASRLMRFHHTTQQIAAPLSAGHELVLADVAHRCGYYDQSHLVREFREFTGTTPTGWISEEHRNIQAGGHRNGAESMA